MTNKVKSPSKVKKEVNTVRKNQLTNTWMDSPEREREALKIKDEESQQAWHHLHYWSAKRIMNSDSEVVFKYGRSWYDWIKLCIEGVPLFEFKDYYNVVVLLNLNQIITNDEAAELFITYYSLHKS